MIWGDKHTDRISLNHEWLWCGVNRSRDNEKVSHHVEEVRELLKRGDFSRATGLANIWFGGLGGVAGTKNRVDPYQPAGDLNFTLKDCTAFRSRELDIEKAVARAERETKKSIICSQFIAHPKHNIIACRWRSEIGRFSGTLSYSRIPDPDAKEQCTYSQNGIEYLCSFNGGISYKVKVILKSNGEIT